MRNLLALTFRLLFKIRYLRSTYFGFYERLFKPFRLFRGVRKRIQYRNGILLDLDLDDWIQQNLYFLNEYEEREIRFVERYLKPGAVFVDLGANIGLFSLVASRVVGTGGKIYAFEPGRDSYAAFIRHIKLNKAENIIAEPMAVASTEGVLSLHTNDEEQNKGGASAYLPTFSKTETVPTTSLDSYFAQKNITSVALIKMDIEGGEYLAQKGMKGVLERYKPHLLIELDPEVIRRTDYKQEEIEGYLCGLGYKKYYVGAEGAIVPEKEPGDSAKNCVFVATGLASTP